MYIYIYIYILYEASYKYLIIYAMNSTIVSLHLFLSRSPPPVGHGAADGRRGGPRGAEPRGGRPKAPAAQRGAELRAGAAGEATEGEGGERRRRRLDSYHILFLIYLYVMYICDIGCKRVILDVYIDILICLYDVYIY